MATQSRWRLLPLVLLLAGCGGGNDSGSFHVVVLGDESRFQVLAELKGYDPTGVRLLAPHASSSAMDVADEAANADFAILVADATVGPTPIVREHVLIARQLRIPTVGILLANTDELLEVMDGDRDLHELVELELRDVLLTYELAGDTAPKFYDSETFDPASSMSVLATALGNGSFPQRPPRASSDVSGAVLSSELYLLTAAEAASVRPIAQGEPVSLWIDSAHIRANADVATPVNPGDAAAVRFRLDSNLSSTIGARFFIETNGDLVGVGTLIALE